MSNNNINQNDTKMGRENINPNEYPPPESNNRIEMTQKEPKLTVITENENENLRENENLFEENTITSNQIQENFVPPINLSHLENRSEASESDSASVRSDDTSRSGQKHQPKKIVIIKHRSKLPLRKLSAVTEEEYRANAHLKTQGKLNDIGIIFNGNKRLNKGILYKNAPVVTDTETETSAVEPKNVQLRKSALENQNIKLQRSVSVSTEPDYENILTRKSSVASVQTSSKYPPFQKGTIETIRRMRFKYQYEEGNQTGLLPNRYSGPSNVAHYRANSEYSPHNGNYFHSMQNPIVPYTSFMDLSNSHCSSTYFPINRNGHDCLTCSIQSTNDQVRKLSQQMHTMRPSTSPLHRTNSLILSPSPTENLLQFLTARRGLVNQNPLKKRNFL